MHLSAVIPGGWLRGTPGHLHNDVYKSPLPKINVFFLQKDGESFYLAQFYLSGLPLNIIYCLITREVIDHAGRM